VELLHRVGEVPCGAIIGVSNRPLKIHLDRLYHLDSKVDDLSLLAQPAHRLPHGLQEGWPSTRCGRSDTRQ
jgi:hypothetical protein